MVLLCRGSRNRPGNVVKILTGGQGAHRFAGLGMIVKVSFLGLGNRF